MNITVINVEWEKIPFDMKEVTKFNNPWDHGVYQIYGDHDAYGENALLYIGQAARQTFGVRLPQEHSNFVESCARPQYIRLGRLVQSFKLEELLEWNLADKDVIIGQVEKILIKAHAPAFNKQENSGLFTNEFKGNELLIINHEDYGRLLPELSTLRMSYHYWNYDLPVGKKLVPIND